jgi:hypothetical protein
MSQWYMLPGDTPLAANIAASIATLISLGDPEVTALKLERAVEERSSDHRCNFLLFPQCAVRGEAVATSEVVRIYRDGSMLRDDPTHPFLICMTALHNADRLLDWMKRGITQALRPVCQQTLCQYDPGTGLLQAYATAQRVTSLAKAAALCTLGMPLLSIEGSGRDHSFIMGSSSVEGMMLNALGEAVSYNAGNLLLASHNDTLAHDHPFELAFAARKNREGFGRVLDREPDSLILTPDTFRKGTVYNPNAAHAIISKNASGGMWDNARKHLLG